jgi:hypothetical protein
VLGSQELRHIYLSARPPAEPFEFRKFPSATISEIPLGSPVAMFDAPSSNFAVHNWRHLQHVSKVKDDLLNPTLFISEHRKENLIRRNLFKQPEGFKLEGEW